MRFDGYLHVEDTGFEPNAFQQKFFETGSLGWANPLDALAAFHFLQRFLYKFGGESLEKDAPEWGFFRKLFLYTARFEVPIRYRGSDLWYPSWYDRWLAQCAPHIEDHISIIEAIDCGTKYQRE
ncbi:MAG: hypothetical protein ABIR71_09330 [Chthoniobacterales bacterium]